jgi:hypothetical protein
MALMRTRSLLTGADHEANYCPLVGTWKLKSFEMRAPDGTVIYPWGRDTKGYATFSPDGYFFAAIMGADRKRFASEDMKGGTLEEKASAADSYITYCGPCEIEKEKFRTKVEVSLFPNWVGEYEERYYKIEGNTLYIWTDPLPVGGKELAGYLIWERT